METSTLAPTIVLTGAGGAAVPTMIDRLRATLPAARIIAVDMDEAAVGLHLADLGVVLPAGNAPEFLPAMRQLCRDEGVRVIVSVVDEELESLCELEDAGIAVIQPRRPFVALTLDKLTLMHTLHAHGLPAPATALASDVDPDALSYPVIVKPRVGRGSRGVARASDPQSLRARLAESSYTASNLMVQQFIDGLEYTVSVVVWRDGEVQAVVPKEIIVKRGVTKVAVTRQHEAIDAYCRDIQRLLRADGPFNVQLCVDRQTGTPYAFEINPRFSTSITLTMAAGVDELTGLILQALGGRDAWRCGDWHEGRIMLRRTTDVFLDEPTYVGRPIRRVLC